MSDTTQHGNVADRLAIIASIMPQSIAVAWPAGPVRPDGTRNYEQITFAELDQQSSQIARGLRADGLEPGMRIVMMVPFGADFIKLTFALLKAGVVAVLIDPGMGKRHLIDCLAQAEPDGFMAISRAQAIRTLVRSRFPKAIHNVTVGRRWFWGGKTLRQIQRLGEDLSIRLPHVDHTDPAAVIFTTGSTGPPKGVLYTHQTFHAQIDRIQSRYGIESGSCDLACFPLFGLFDAVMGVTTIIPEMDPTKPASVNPQRLLEAISQWQCDQAFGSPALWNTVVQWAEKNQESRPFPTLRRVLSAGAPVPAETLEKLRSIIHPDAIIVTPYGATEALPIASIESREILTETAHATSQGKGVCVGTRFDEVQWRVIEMEDGPLETIDQTVEIKRGQIGELMVSGPMVTTQYVVRQDQNPFHKIRDGDRIWHRMGDVGYLDDQDRFWFCGRKAHRVVCGEQTWFTVPCEAVFNSHPQVYRSALVGRGQRPEQTPVILVEPHSQPQSYSEREKLIAELHELSANNPLTRQLDEILLRDQPLPVDIRHNSKIFRERLASELGKG